MGNALYFCLKLHRPLLLSGMRHTDLVAIWRVNSEVSATIRKSIIVMALVRQLIELNLTRHFADRQF